MCFSLNKNKKELIEKLNNFTDEFYNLVVGFEEYEYNTKEDDYKVGKIDYYIQNKQENLYSLWIQTIKCYQTLLFYLFSRVFSVFLACFCGYIYILLLYRLYYKSLSYRIAHAV